MAAELKATSPDSVELKATPPDSVEPGTTAPQTALRPTHLDSGELTRIPPDPGARRDTAVTQAWPGVLGDPGHAPEILALAAVQVIGPRARDWADRMRETYPQATAEGLARLATRRFTRSAGLRGALAAVSGSYAPVALLGAAAVTQAELVLHLAAAYGVDPADPGRAADLLVCTGLYQRRADAEVALAEARRPGRDTDAVFRVSRMLAAPAAAWGVLRLAARVLPGVGLLGAVLAGHSAAEAVAARTRRYYRRLDTAR